MVLLIDDQLNHLIVMIKMIEGIEDFECIHRLNLDLQLNSIDFLLLKKLENSINLNKVKERVSNFL